MSISEDTIVSHQDRNWLYSLLSLVIPGSGQFLVGKRWRGVILLLAVAILTYVTYWAQVDRKLGLVTLGGVTLSLLWLPLILFWLWNVLDAHRLVAGQSTNTLVGVFLAAVILYSVAWNATQVKPERLVTRFNDAKSVATNLINPDIITITINGEEKICSWQCA